MMSRDLTLCTKPRLACRLYRAWHLRTTRYVDLFVSPSRFLRDLHVRAGLESGRHILVHNGIPLPDDVTAIRTRRTADAHKRFLMLSRLTEEKGIRVLLRAFSLLPPDLDIEIAIAGRGALEEEVRAAAAADPRLVFHGFLDGEAKSAALARAGTLLLPSLWYENAPVAIVEAAAYGLGVIGSDIGAIPEFIENGQTGLLFPAGDAAALAGVIARVARQPDSLPGLQVRTQVVARHYSVDRMVDDYSYHYNVLLQRQSECLAAQ